MIEFGVPDVGYSVREPLNAAMVAEVYLSHLK